MTDQKTQPAVPEYAERWRAQIHFSIRDSRINDPNGLVYHQGVYQLYYQCLPHGENIEAYCGDSGVLRVSDASFASGQLGVCMFCGCRICRACDFCNCIIISVGKAGDHNCTNTKKLVDISTDVCYNTFKPVEFSTSGGEYGGTV